RHINRQLYRSATLSKVFPVTERCQDYALGKFMHGIFAGVRQEQSGRDYAARGMPRAHEGFGTNEMCRPEFDLRLIPELHPVVTEYRTERNRRFRVGIGDRP